MEKVKKRSHNLQIRVTSAEKKEIEDQASKAGLSMASYVRSTVLDRVRSAKAE